MGRDLSGRHCAAFFAAMREAHRAAGAPSTRTVGSAIGWSHTHIAWTLNGTTLSAVELVEDLARHFGADLVALRGLHVAALRESGQSKRRGGRG